MDLFEQIIVKIIRNQEAIIGPVAVERALSVPNLELNWETHTAALKGDESEAIGNLVGVYKELFGQISVEVCKEAASSLINQLPPDQQPEALK